MFKNLLSDKQTPAKVFLGGIQSFLACSVAIILVPRITGLPVSATLFVMGLATIAYCFITGFKIPMVLGSSFAFIAPILTVQELYGINYVYGGLISVGIMTTIFSLIVKKFGTTIIKKFLPSVITGTVIITIGLSLVPTGVSMASTINGEYSLIGLFVALITLSGAIISNFIKPLRPYSILCGFIVGFISSLLFGLVNFTPLREASLFISPLSTWVIPMFNLPTILMFCIVNLATLMESIGDTYTISAVCEENFYEKPGLWRCLLGDAAGDLIGGLACGPSSTSYGENIGVIALTKNKSVWNVLCAAVIMIVMSIIGSVVGFIDSIPSVVIGGLSCLSYALIASSGMRILVEAGINYKDNRNLIITAVGLFTGIGGLTIRFAMGGGLIFSFGGIALGSLLMIILNLVLPKNNN
jgi:uracil permease